MFLFYADVVPLGNRQKEERSKGGCQIIVCINEIRENSKEYYDSKGEVFKLCSQSFSFFCCVSRSLLSPRCGSLTMNHRYLCVESVSLGHSQMWQETIKTSLVEGGPLW